MKKLMYMKKEGKLSSISFKAYATEMNKALFNVQIYSNLRYYLWTYVFTLYLNMSVLKYRIKIRYANIFCGT